MGKKKKRIPPSIEYVGIFLFGLQKLVTYPCDYSQISTANGPSILAAAKAVMNHGDKARQPPPPGTFTCCMGPAKAGDEKDWHKI